MDRKPKVVLDTNLFVAARFNPGSSSARIIDGCLEKKYEVISSPRLRREAESILKNVKASEEFRMKARRLFKGAYVIKPAKRVRLIREDPADNKFLECAVGGRADYLVTSDRHLLRLGRFKGTKICKPGQFLELVGDQGSNYLSGPLCEQFT